MPDKLTDDDYCLLSPLQHDRLRSHFPAELQDAVLLTRADATLVVSCDWEAIALLNEDWDCFAHFVYVFTGCSLTTFYIDGVAVLTQTRAGLSDSRTPTIQLQQSVNEAAAMVATAERRQTKQDKAVKQMVQAAETVVATQPQRTIADVVYELTDLIAAQAVAKVEASAVMVSHAMREHEANGNTPEQAPSAVIDATPTKLPKVRLIGIYTPTKSNWVQSAKRYLKAVDPTGDAAKALEAIVTQSPTGLAHIERAVREYPEPDREAARTRLYQGFVKVLAERNGTDRLA